MTTADRPPSLVTFALLLIFILAGCSPTVREDRTIEYSATGEAVAFQHGKDGVYVASADGSKLEKVFDSADALAVSSPLFSADSGRMIFTTAIPLDKRLQPGSSLVEDWEASPEGRRFTKMPIEYTCWMRNVVRDEANNEEPVKLFSAILDHPGYVAANVAVRWHPDGQSVLFLKQVDGNRVTLFEFDLQTQTTRQLLNRHANAMIFDWSNTNQYLVCSLLGAASHTTDDGLWIIDREDLENPVDNITAPDQWRRVENARWTNVLAGSESLDYLRQTRPAWTADDTQFAFPSQHLVDHRKTVSSIYVVQPETGQSHQLYQTDNLVRDIRWHPDSKRLAFIERAAVDQLMLMAPDGTVALAVGNHSLRAFVGWNFDGSRLAYTSPEPTVKPEDHWAVLFTPIDGARDRVFVADGMAAANPQLVHDKLRITFPNWSPTANEMSLWGTYSPSHQSILSHLLPWTLRPGDPAATLDIDTKTLRWMAVNSHERSQVGHYYLMKRDYEQAWQWYEKAAVDRQPTPKLTINNMMEMAMQRSIHHDPLLFESYCLWKLDRKAEAAERFAAFKQAMSLDLADGGGPFLNPASMDAENRSQVEDAIAFINAFMQASYMTEVFLSLDAAEDGLTIFNENVSDTELDDERLARLICQSQLLLILGRYQDYSILVRNELATFLPRLDSVENTFQQLSISEPGRSLASVKRFISSVAIGAACLPMAANEFLDLLSDEEVHDSIDSWVRNRDTATSEEHQVACDIILRSLLQRGTDGDPNGRLETLRAEVDQRLTSSELGQKVVSSIDEAIKNGRNSGATNW